MPIRKVTSLEENQSAASQMEAKNNSGTATLIAIIVVAVLAVVGCVFLYMKYDTAQKKINSMTNPQAQQELIKKEMDSLLKKVGKLIVLPSDEQPTVATVTNADALKAEQPFYKDAQNGDKVIIYVQSRKAIIYNEAKGILVNVGPIFINENAAAAAVNTNTEQEAE